METNANVIIRELASHCPMGVLRRFIAKIKGVSCFEIMFHSDEIALEKKEAKQLCEMVHEYKLKKPVSKILNEREFWKSKFFVNEHVLDPRPETELIIEKSLDLFNKDQKFSFLDIGTGSGCILLSLAKEFPNSYGVGIDISDKATQIAKTNKKNLQVSNVSIFQADWNKFSSPNRFDLVVSNPPYIKSDEIQNLDEGVRVFDPILALDGGASGLLAYEQLSLVIKSWLKPEGYVLLEIGINQSKPVKKIFEDAGFHLDNINFDLHGIPRVLEFSHFAS